MFSALLLWVSQLWSCCSLLAFSFEVCCFHFRHRKKFRFLNAWCKKIHFLSLQTSGNKGQGGIIAKWMATGSIAGPKRVHVSWGQSQAETLREAEGHLQLWAWWAREEVLAGWHRSLTGLGLVATESACSPKEAAEQPAEDLDVILTACAIKPNQLSPAQHWFVCDLTWEALPCLLLVDFSNLVRLPGTPGIVAWLREKNTVAGNSNSSFCLMHLIEEKLKSQTNMQPGCTS